MLTFKPVELSDKELLDQYLLKNPYGNCDFSFANIYIWRKTYDTRFAVSDGFLVLLSRLEAFLMPLGEGDLGAVLTKMMAYADEKGFPFQISAVTPEGQLALDGVMPGKFRFIDNRDWYDYQYNTDDLIYLKGKKYHAKRNHINRFAQDYPDYEYIDITPELIPAVKECHRQWVEENYEEGDVEQHGETVAVTEALDHFSELKLRGGAIRIGGKIVAFALGQPLNDRVFCVHIEKALSNYATAYTVINRCFAHRNAEGYALVNREEDLGIEGLRKAKLSYQPARILEKRLCVLRDENDH